MLIDTHCHIHDRDTYAYAVKHQQSQGNHQTIDDFTSEKIIARAAEAGIGKMVCIGTTHEDSLCASAFAAQHDNVYWSYGIHPEECEKLVPENACDQRGAHSTASPITMGASKRFSDASFLHASRLVAVGEVGLDYHSDGYNRPAQIKLLEQMLELAQQHDLPLVFHVRTDAAFRDFWPIIDNAHIKRAVVHSFSDGQEHLEAALEHDFYIGINGLATFANLYPHGLPPLDRILLETDAPFLTPAPCRGQVNEPAHIKDIAQWLADKTGQSLDAVATQTTENATKLLRF